jgi:hypothetical protein
MQQLLSWGCVLAMVMLDDMLLEICALLHCPVVSTVAAVVTVHVQNSVCACM